MENQFNQDQNQQNINPAPSVFGGSFQAQTQVQSQSEQVEQNQNSQESQFQQFQQEQAQQFQQEAQQSVQADFQGAQNFQAPELQFTQEQQSQDFSQSEVQENQQQEQPQQFSQSQTKQENQEQTQVQQEFQIQQQLETQQEEQVSQGQNIFQQVQNQEQESQEVQKPEQEEKKDEGIEYPEDFDSYDLKGKILSLLTTNLASDCYPVVGYHLGVKVHGSIFPAERLGKLSKEQVEEFLSGIFAEKQAKEFEEELETDFAYEWVDKQGVHHRFRVNAFHQGKNPSATLRYLRADIKSLDDLGMPPILKDLAERNSGIVLLCGVTGSGKSTTIAAMIDHINANFAKHIISIEDPVEYTFDKKKSWIEQREVGTDTVTFARAMKSALRQNPNVLFLGEMRDLESIGAAITIAESGHLVLSTIHARNSEQCINKIIDSFPAAQQNQVRLQLSEAVAGIVTQKLIPKKNGKGVKLVMEVMVNNSAIGNLIRENQVHQLESVIQTGKQSGMKLLDEDILDAFKANEITAENAVKYSNNPAEMEKSLRELGMQI